MTRCAAAALTRRRARLRRRHHRRRPQRARLRGVSRAAPGSTVCVLERRGVVGGAAVTEEFHPGLPQLHRELHRQPARSAGHPRSRARRARAAIVERPFSNFLPLPDGDYLKVGGGLAATQAEVARFLARATPSALPAYYAMLDRVADVLRELLLETPPNVGGGSRDALLDAWKVAQPLPRARLARASATCSTSSPRARATSSIAGSSPTPIKAAFGFDAVVGNFASPYTPGSAYVLLHHVFGEVNGKRGQWGHAHRRHGRDHAGDGARSASRAASKIRTATPVARVIVERGRAAGVELDGRRGRSRARASSPT